MEVAGLKDRARSTPHLKNKSPGLKVDSPRMSKTPPAWKGSPALKSDFVSPQVADTSGVSEQTRSHFTPPTVPPLPLPSLGPPPPPPPPPSLNVPPPPPPPPPPSSSLLLPLLPPLSGPLLFSLGKMLLDDKKNVAHNPYRRPYACGVLDVVSVLREKEEEDRQHEDGYKHTFTMPLYLW